jgi:hypothetical protein
VSWDRIIIGAGLLLLGGVSLAIAWHQAKEVVRSALDGIRSEPHRYDPDDCRSEDQQAADWERGR